MVGIEPEPGRVEQEFGIPADPGSLLHGLGRLLLLLEGLQRIG